MIDTAQLLSILSGLSFGPGENSGSTWSTGGINYARDPQTGEWGKPTTTDPTLQKYIDQGVISGTSVDFSKLPSTVYGVPFGEVGGAGFRNVGVDESSGRPTISGEKNVNIGNPTNVRWDPNYGWITPQGNVRNKDDWYDTFSGQILPALIAGGMTAGAGSLVGGGLAGQLFNLPKTFGALMGGGARGGGANPLLSLLSSAFGKTQGGSTGNPLQQLMELISNMGRGGSNG